VADWILLSSTWDETPELRALGLEIDKALIDVCYGVILCGSRVSPGMAIERDHCIATGGHVINLTHFGWDEPPPDPWSLERLMRGGKNG
jgi:hypothetical protein